METEDWIKADTISQASSSSTASTTSLVFSLVVRFTHPDSTPRPLSSGCGDYILTEMSLADEFKNDPRNPATKRNNGAAGGH